MSGARKAWLLGVITISGLIVSGWLADAVHADRYTSTDYTINASVMNSFGGQGTSTDYKLTSSGGESIIGNGAGGSYKLGAGYVAQLAQTIQLRVQPSGLAAYYPLDENAGTSTADASGHHHQATLDAAAAWSATGKIGAAVNTSGGGAVNAPNSADIPSGNALTVEAWINEAAAASNKAIASHWNYSTSGSWALQTGPNNNLRMLIASAQNDTGTNYVDTPTGSLGSAATWHHVAVTYDGTQTQANMVKVYIDGTPVGTTITGTLPATLQNSTSTFSIGSFPGLGYYFNGAIDEVKLFNRALTTGEVTAEYTAGSSGVTGGAGLGSIVPGASNTASQDAIVTTNQTGYTLAVSQNHDLQNGANTVPAVGGTIASPLTWTEGTTKGFGFSLLSSTVAGSIPAKWNSGASYAAFPATSASFYTRTGPTGGTGDVLTIRLRADVATTQVAGNYQNTLTYTATTTP